MVANLGGYRTAALPGPYRTGLASGAPTLARGQQLPSASLRADANFEQRADGFATPTILFKALSEWRFWITQTARETCVGSIPIPLTAPCGSTENEVGEQGG